MSRYNSNYILIYAPSYQDLNLLFKEEIFQSYWDLFSIEGNGFFMKISITQLGRLRYISDELSEKYPDFIFLETRSGEAGYREDYLTKGKSKKRLDVHFELIPRKNYKEIDSYLEENGDKHGNRKP